MHLSYRTIWSSFVYLGISLILVYFGNERGEKSPLENLAHSGVGITLLYYLAQIGLMVSYMRFHRLSWGISTLILVIVALLRSISSGVAILTVAMVMGREVVTEVRARDDQ